MESAWLFLHFIAQGCVQISCLTLDVIYYIAKKNYEWLIA